VEEKSIFLGCTVSNGKNGSKIVLISVNREIEGMNFMKEVGWHGDG
jgi:hypothetical protein